MTDKPEPEPSWCFECGQNPARMLLPDSGRRLCGVCAHRLAIAQDLARRIHRARTRVPQRVA